MNGLNRVFIKSLHGVYSFNLQRFVGSDEIKTYFDAVNMYQNMTKDYESHELCRYRSEYCNMLPYRKLKDNIDTRIGDIGYSSSQLQKKTIETAIDISNYELSKYDGLQLCLPLVDTCFDLYSPEVKEVLLFEDGIGVKRQKDKREDENYKKPTKRVQSDVIAIERGERIEEIESAYRYLSPLLNKKGEIALNMTERLRIEWSKLYKGEPVALVVISDGARNIRKRLETVFGKSVTIILDWFHLKKRVNENMSMMGFKKEDKKEHIKQILSYLWYGQYDETIKYIQNLKPYKSRVYKQNELLTYLDKHKKELIDYRLRKEKGKKVGSGKAEVSVNQVIGSRQKKKGMSWTPKGSHALGILKTLELNQEVNQFWDNKKAA